MAMNHKKNFSTERQKPMTDGSILRPLSARPTIHKIMEIMIFAIINRTSAKKMRRPTSMLASIMPSTSEDHFSVVYH